MPGHPSPEDLCRLLGLRHPIIQAPMAGVQGHELAAAASRAGALGSLPSATFSAAVRAGRRLYCWNTKPTFRAR